MGESPSSGEESDQPRERQVREGQGTRGRHEQPRRDTAALEGYRRLEDESPGGSVWAQEERIRGRTGKGDPTENEGAPRAHPSFFMNSLRVGALPAKGVRDLGFLCPPLCKGYAAPPKQDLSKFWAKVEGRLPGLCPDLDFSEFRESHVHALGPHLLGDVVWDSVSLDDVGSWGKFKRAVEARFGLTTGERDAAFQELSKCAGESDARFILRVEDERRRYGHGTALCVTTYLPRTSEDFRARFWASAHYVARDRDCAVLTWEDLVKFSRTEDTIQGRTRGAL